MQEGCAVMLKLKVKGIDGLQNMFKDFHQINPRAISLAMNETARTATTASLKKVRKNWNIKAGDLKRYVSAKPANVNNAKYVFKFHSRAINLQEFEGVDENPKGVRYKIQKKRAWMPDAFIKGTGRNKFVLKRTTKDRYPLRPHFSITPSTMFLKEKGEDEFVNVFYRGKGKTGAGEGFQARYFHQLKRLSKY